MKLFKRYARRVNEKDKKKKTDPFYESEWYVRNYRSLDGDSAWNFSYLLLSRYPDLHILFFFL